MSKAMILLIPWGLIQEKEDFQSYILGLQILFNIVNKIGNDPVQQ
jgi:hypothetical protein